MMRQLAAAALAVLVLSCAPEPNPVRGVQTRVAVERTQTRVGDSLGVLIEVDTPKGFTIEQPASPSDTAGFVTDELGLLQPIGVPGGLRHRLRWTVRASEPGEYVLPTLEIPLVDASGRFQLLRAGGVPVRVRSVMEELPSREVFFDIRPLPPLRSRGSWIGVAGAAVGMLALLACGAFVLIRSDPSRRRAGPRALGRRASARIDAALRDPETDPRCQAKRLADVVWWFTSQRWQLEITSLTPPELPEQVESKLIAHLERLEHARFERLPTWEIVARAGRDARGYFEDVAGR